MISLISSISSTSSISSISSISIGIVIRMSSISSGIVPLVTITQPCFCIILDFSASLIAAFIKLNDLLEIITITIQINILLNLEIMNNKYQFYIKMIKLNL